MILVTGASGLLGTELVKQLLDKGHTVKALYNSTALSIKEHPALIPVCCNILDIPALEEAMDGVDEVYHCAALVSFHPGDVSRLYKVNVEGTANVVNAAIDAGVDKFMFVSSVAALGRIREGVMINEDMQWTKETSNSRYGQSKYLAELEVWRGMAEGLRAAVVNPSIILGPGKMDAGSTKIFESVYNEFPWYTEGTTGFVDVRDVASAMIMLMEKNIFSRRFIVSAENASYGRVFSLIAGFFGKKAPHRKVTPFLASVVWRLEKLKAMFSGSKPLITKETTLTALAKVQYDNGKLKNMLPEFAYRNLEDTLKDTCHALKATLH